MSATKSKRITVLCAESELTILRDLEVKHHGASRPELLRLGIHALAGAEPRVVIQPQILPLPALKQTWMKINALTGLLNAAIRNGWPDSLDGESAERTAKVHEARKEFEDTVAQLKPLRNELFVVMTACAALSQADDIPRLRSAASRLDSWCRAKMEKDGPESVPIYRHLLQLLVILGITCPSPVGIPAATSFKLDLGLLHKATAGIRESVKVLRTSGEQRDKLGDYECLLQFLIRITEATEGA